MWWLVLRQQWHAFWWRTYENNNNNSRHTIAWHLLCKPQPACKWIYMRHTKRNFIFALNLIWWIKNSYKLLNIKYFGRFEWFSHSLLNSVLLFSHFEFAMYVNIFVIDSFIIRIVLFFSMMNCYFCCKRFEFWLHHING